MTSSMLDREMRAMMPTDHALKLIVGNTRWAKRSPGPEGPRIETMPPTGKIRSQTDPLRISNSPSQNEGMLLRNSATSMPITSKTDPGRVADRMPAGIPARIATTMLAAPRSAVFRKLVNTSEVTGCASDVEVPRSPWTARSNQRRYWMATGRSRPIAARSWRTSSGVPCGPSSVAAGSPGISLIMRKTTTLTPRRTRAVPTRRRQTKTYTLGSSGPHQRVKDIAHTVADQIEAEGDEEDGESGNRRHRGRKRDDRPALAEHDTPIRSRRLNAESKKAEAGSEDDVASSLQRCVHDHGGHDVDKHMPY